jgi:hypothetical protein
MIGIDKTPASATSIVRFALAARARRALTGLGRDPYVPPPERSPDPLA